MSYQRPALTQLLGRAVVYVCISYRLLGWWSHNRESRLAMGDGKHDCIIVSLHTHLQGSLH